MKPQLPVGDDTRRALLMGGAEAARLGHEYIGTEHILLGLLRDDGGDVARALRTLGVEPSMLGRSVDAVLQPGRDRRDPDELRPFTSRCQTVMVESDREAAERGHSSITAGDMLIGLLRERVGIGGQMLAQAGVDPAAIRSALP